jgi:hypothetical protein
MTFDDERDAGNGDRYGEQRSGNATKRAEV